jgi:DNA-binding transcriptional LysR family regulator
MSSAPNSSSATPHESMRLPCPDDENKDILSRIVSEFAQSHPLVELEVTCALSASFARALAAGTMDIAVYQLEHPNPGLEVLREEQTSWMVSRHHDFLSRDPIPIALFDRACWWRDAALNTLTAMGRPYRIVYSSQSVAGVSAAIEAGIAIGLLGLSSMSENLRQLGPQDDFSESPMSRLVLGLSEDADSPEIRIMHPQSSRLIQLADSSVCSFAN